MKRILLVLSLMMIVTPIFGDEKEGGIVGTGVVGSVTGVDQFEVSGMRFGFSSDLELKGLKSLEDLRMGMTLVLSTAPDGNAWQATQLRHLPVLSGPVTGPNEVMGVPVTGDLEDAASVTVDGFWSKTGVVASRISPAPAGLQQVTGVYDADQATVGRVKVQAAPSLSLADGKIFTVTGRFENDLLVAETVETELFMGNAPDLILVEGFFSEPNEKDEVSLNGVAVAAATEGGAIDPATQVRRCALRGRLDFALSDLPANELATIESFCATVLPRE
ncbi:hypothetical protein [Pelagibius sp. Alg239-R121]|uniref:hypothetical protein n=1 Tax=Pelagibius sp. Alg239-R121 TaxID=2993448 RepID=UPI0024A708CE|nr:hypothetical protein [Pelagibius sp. Alg239-R121]